ncbi:hypothetical protein ACVWZV_003773 [Bradyrhizobium sp. GM5.1]
MQIAVVIGQFVVPAVHCRPGQHGAAAGHRSHHDQDRTHRRGGREGAVGEEPVIADGKAEAGDQPEADGQAKLHRADRAVEQKDQRQQRADEGQNVEDHEMPALHPAKMPAADNSMIALLLHGRDSRAPTMSTYPRGGRNPSHRPRFQQPGKPIQ